MSDPIQLPEPGVTRDWGPILNAAIREVVRRVSGAMGVNDGLMAAIFRNPDADATKEMARTVSEAIEPVADYQPENIEGVGQILGWDAATKRTYIADLSPLENPDVIRAISTGDQAAPSTSMVFDNELGAGFDAPGVYRGTMRIPYSASVSGDFKFGFNIPADAELAWSYRGIRVDGSAAADQNSSYTFVGVQLDKTGIGRVGGTGAAFINFVNIECLLKIVTPGVLRFQFGMNSNDATTPTIRRKDATMLFEDWGSAAAPRNGMQFILNEQIWRPNSPEKPHSLLIQRNSGTPADMATFRSAYTRHELRPGDQWFGDASKGKGVERCEMASATYWSFGVDIWESFQFRYTGPLVEKDENGNGYLLINQFIQSPPQDGETKIPHCLSVYLTGGRFTIDTRGDANPITTQKFPPTPRVDVPFTVGAWHNAVLRVRLGYDSNGELDVWLDGVKVAEVRGAVIGYNDPRGPRAKFGPYRSAQAFTNVLEFANFELGYDDLSSRITTPLPRALPAGIAA